MARPKQKRLKLSSFRSPLPTTSSRVVDLHHLFFRLDRSGRFRDWVRRVVVPTIGLEEVYAYNPKDYTFSSSALTAELHEGSERHYFIRVCRIKDLTDLKYELSLTRIGLNTDGIKEVEKAVEGDKLPPLPKRNLTKETRHVLENRHERIKNAPVANTSDIEYEVSTKKVRVHKEQVQVTVKVPKTNLRTSRKGISLAWRREQKKPAPVKLEHTPAPAPAPAPKVSPDGLLKRGQVAKVEGLVLSFPLQGYSINHMYHHPISGRSKLTKTPGYAQWKRRAISMIQMAAARNVKELGLVDYSEPMGIRIMMHHMPDFDTNNLVKSTIDAISEALGFNDVLIKEHYIRGFDIKRWGDQNTQFVLYNL